MKIEEKNFKTYSMIGSRATFGLVVLELAKKNKNIIAISADTSTSAGLDRLKKQLPNNFLDVGISEQNLIGIATGLSSEGFDVFTTTFAPFQTMRCCEQIRVNLGYMKHKICMVGLASGLALGTLGFTHCCIEDLSIMRSLPNITVLSPADCVETAKATVAALEHKNPIYIRLTGVSNQPSVYEKDYNFEIGKGIIIKEGTDIAIFATGTMVYESLQASKILDEKGVSTKVINIHTIKPFDNELVENISKKVKNIVTVEEHSIVGGLGSSVAEAKSKIKNSPAQISIGLPLEFGKSQNYKDMLKNYKLTGSQIAQTILEKI
tara:strand:- start:487 stop:1449 length:963 start_codon:yes stop_codon:yes gene_type:complete